MYLYAILIVEKEIGGKFLSNEVYSIEQIKNIIAPIAKQHGVQRVFLFGSYAKGIATSTSDIDLCIDSSNLNSLFALGGFYADLEEALNKSVDMVTENSLKYNTDAFFLENLKRDRLLIYDYAN